MNALADTSDASLCKTVAAWCQSTAAIKHYVKQFLSAVSLSNNANTPTPPPPEQHTPTPPHQLPHPIRTATPTTTGVAASAPSNNAAKLVLFSAQCVCFIRLSMHGSPVSQHRSDLYHMSQCCHPLTTDHSEYQNPVEQPSSILAPTNKVYMWIRPLIGGMWWQRIIRECWKFVDELTVVGRQRDQSTHRQRTRQDAAHFTVLSCHQLQLYRWIRAPAAVTRKQTALMSCCISMISTQHNMYCGSITAQFLFIIMFNYT